MAATKQLVKAKKNWYPIVAPEGFNNALLGESPVADLDELIGRTVSINLMTLTNDMKHQNVNLSFKVLKSADGKAVTEVIGYETSPSSIKRFVRRDISRLDDSFVVETGDNKLVRVKIMVLTKNKTTSSILKVVRRTMIDQVALEAEKTDFESFLKDIIYHKLQGAIRDNLKKIYPVRAFEVKRVELLKKNTSRIVKAKKPEQAEARKLKKKVNEETAEE